MSSNIKVERICEWCGKKFIAQTTVTRFCSKRCAEHSYKERLRQKKLAVSNLETSSTTNGNKWREKDYLTPTQAADLLGIGRMSIYRYIRNGKIKVVRFERKTLISKADFLEYFESKTKEKYQKWEIVYKHFKDFCNCRCLMKDVTIGLCNLLITNGTDIYTVSKMLTHKNVSTTQIYAEVVNQKKRDAANSISLK